MEVEEGGCGGGGGGGGEGEGNHSKQGTIVEGT